MVQQVVCESGAGRGKAIAPPGSAPITMFQQSCDSPAVHVNCGWAKPQSERENG
jgi:hypothetical protein